MDLFDNIIKALDDVVENASSWSRDSLMDAMSLNKAMLDFEFIITLYVVERYLSYTENLTRSLQAKALDILRAVDHTPQSALKHTSLLLFPNIRKMLIHMMVLPVTSCEAERSFSTLRRSKTYLHTTMSQQRLNGLVLLNIPHTYHPRCKLELSF